MANLQEMITEYRAAQQTANGLYNQIRQVKDGFLYISCLRCYGSVSYMLEPNNFIVQELCNEYSGDNGIVDVYTNNPAHGLETYGTVTVLTDEELNDEAAVEEMYYRIGHIVKRWRVEKALI
jgi:hypothetical protein